MRELPNRLFRALASIALLLSVALLPAAPAAASPTQPTMLQDDPQLIYRSSAVRFGRLDELKSLGVDIVKVRVNWRGLAPSHRPADGSDPAVYGDRWGPYDEIVSGAEARGMGVLFQIGGSAPEWATPGPGKSAIRNPNAAEFGKFVEAVGTRYPSVKLFSFWNEVNLISWLSPQVTGGIPQSPRIYRGLVNAGAKGLEASGHADDQLLLGELLPFTRSSRKSTKKMRPIEFLRELACLDSHYRAYRGSAAKKRGCVGFKALPGTGLAYHPYTLAGGPNVKTPNPDDASIRDLGRVTKALSRLRSKKRIRSSWSVWITEFGFQSRPPDPYATPIGKIPGYMGEAEYLAYKNRRVSSYAQYPLVDDAGRVAGFQSGLRFHSGKQKPGVFTAFQRPLFARYSGSRVELFGGLRAASGGSVTLQTRVGKGSWKTLRSAGLNSRGYFDVTVKLSKVSKRYFRFFGSGQPASRAAKAVKR